MRGDEKGEQPEARPAGETSREEHTEALKALITAGLTFGDVVTAFAAQRTPEHVAVVAEADRLWAKDGEIEIDDTAIVSESADNGAYVMGWLWVSNPGADEEDDVRGCSCGMADHGAPGHDGDPTSSGHIASLPAAIATSPTANSPDVRILAEQIAGAFPEADGEDLDETVHDCASLNASQINNNGIAAQITYLLGQGVPEEEIRDVLAAEAGTRRDATSITPA